MARIESTTSNTRYAVRDSDRGEGLAILESIISNTHYAVGDSNRGERMASIKSILSNTRYAIGDDCILAASNEGIGSSFYNRIAVLTTVIYRVATFNDHRHQRIAESSTSNICYAVADSDGS